MSVETRSITRALERLAAAVAERDENERRMAARRVATQLAGIQTLPPWMREGDLRFYLGLAQYHAGHLEDAERTLSSAPLEVPWAAEAQWVLAKIVSSQLNQENASRLRPRLFEHYGRIAELCPLSLMAQFTADYQTDQREAAAGPGGAPRAFPVTKLGRRYDWQTLVTVGELYRQQNLLREAADAYGWSVQVRYPDEWFQSGVADMWLRISDRYERLGERELALRYLAKRFALPLTAEEISRTSGRMEVLEDRPRMEPPVPRPDAQKLIQIGDLLSEMELFDQSVTAYRQAGARGGQPALLVASALEKKAQFLFDYRSERSRHTMLFGAPLTWEKVEQAFEQAKQQYAAARPGNGNAAVGIERCDAALKRLKELR